MVKLPDQAANEKIRMREIFLAEFLRGFRLFRANRDRRARPCDQGNCGNSCRLLLAPHSLCDQMVMANKRLFSTCWASIKCCTSSGDSQFAPNLRRSDPRDRITTEAQLAAVLGVEASGKVCLT